jgi:cytochrome c oxidase subunit II
MCGKGHFSMRGVIVVESQAEFNAWLATKQPQYLAAMGANGDGVALPPAGTLPSDTTRVPGTDTTSAGATRTMK